MSHDRACLEVLTEEHEVIPEHHQAVHRQGPSVVVDHGGQLCVL